MIELACVCGGAGEIALLAAVAAALGAVWRFVWRRSEESCDG